MKFVRTLVCIVFAASLVSACAGGKRQQSRTDTAALAKKIAKNLYYERKTFRDQDCPNGAARAFSARLGDMQVKVPVEHFKAAITFLDTKYPRQSLVNLLVNQKKDGLAGCPGDPYPSLSVDLVPESYGLPEALGVSLWDLEGARKNIRTRSAQAEVARDSEDCTPQGNGVRACPFIEVKTRRNKTVEEKHTFIFIPETEGKPTIRCADKTRSCTLFMEVDGMGVRMAYVVGSIEHRDAARRIDEVKRIAAAYLRTDV